MYPSKYFEKFSDKNAIKHENREFPTPRFYHNSRYPPQKYFENDCASMPVNSYGFC
jgi:hypothetical protein